MKTEERKEKEREKKISRLGTWQPQWNPTRG